jgi:hypothetical protein
MKQPPLIQASLLIQAVKSRTHKVTLARINPQDIPSVDLTLIRMALGGAEILPSQDVERGYLYVTTKQLR